MPGKALRHLKYDPLEYLLSSRRPAWVRYRTLADVLGRSSEDPQVVALRQERDASAAVAKLRARQSTDGSFPCMPWRHVHKFYLNQLLQMGYGLENNTVNTAVESILQDQLPGGGYNPDLRTADGRERAARREVGNWSPCMTGFVTAHLLDLGLRNDARVKALLDLLAMSQRDSGGWICRRNETRAPYCILGGTPWTLAALAHGGRACAAEWDLGCCLEILEMHKHKIMRHGYERDYCYRCNEGLLLPALFAAGLSVRDRLVSDLCSSLVSKQRPNGAWMFAGKESAWYTLEAASAIRLAAERP